MTETTEPVETSPRSTERADARPRRAVDRWFLVALLAVVAVGLTVRVVYTLHVSTDLPFTGVRKPKLSRQDGKLCLQGST